MTQRTLDRRTFLATTAALGTVTTLAGCAGDADDGNDGGSDGNDGGDDGNDDGGSDDGEGNDEFLADEPDYDGWLDDVDNYEGTLDRTDADEVRVDVGAEGGLAYAPPAVAVSPGTTVVWEWTGDGGDHNVSEMDGAFESELVAEAGHTFEHTLEESGVYTYVCTPHEAVGMKGAVYVV